VAPNRSRQGITLARWVDQQFSQTRQDLVGPGKQELEEITDAEGSTPVQAGHDALEKTA
jgi:hypothetical protein